MHAHTAPALFKRHIDDAALAQYAAAFGMRGFVLKDHDASTTGRAYYVNRMHPQVQSFGAVVLNRSAGGLPPSTTGPRSCGCRRTIRSTTPNSSTCPITRSSGAPASSFPATV